MNLARRIADAARRMMLPLVQTAMALAVIVGAFAFGSPAQAQATYSYPFAGGQTVTPLDYWPGLVLYNDQNGSQVNYMQFNIPAGKTYTSASLDYYHQAYTNTEPHTVTLVLLSSVPPGGNPGIAQVRAGVPVGSFEVLSDLNPGTATLSAAVVARMNSLSAAGGGVLFLGAHAPTTVNYLFGEFHTVNLVGNTNEPGVTGLSPATGSSAGGNTVVITGLNLGSATSVRFGTTLALGHAVINSTTIQATAPAGTGAVNVRVTTPVGTSETAPGNLYTYTTQPVVTAVSPNQGATGAGQVVTITGSGFSGTTGPGGVKFGAANATGYTVQSDTQITASAPANAAGTYDVTVTNAGNVSPTSAASQYTYVAAPAVTAVSPTAGPTSGGTSVTITGTGFAAAPATGAVRFGAVNATYTINSNTQITATAPARAAGTYDITVTTPGGASPISAADQFTYVSAPTVTAVSPNLGQLAGGTTVVITGAGFSGATAVSFGANAASGYTIDSNTQITATSPSGAGLVDIRVTTIGGTSATSAADRFTYMSAPTASNHTYATVIPYNDGANTPTTFSLAGQVTNSPTAYLPGSATTAQGGSVSIDSAGLVSYTPLVGYRNANDSFTFTVSNLAGTSAPATVTLIIGDPTLAVSLPAMTGEVGVAYNSGAAPVTVSGGRAPYASFSATGLPAGLTMNSSGVISGTPTTAGNNTVQVTVTDSSTGAGPYIATVSAVLNIALPNIVVSPLAPALPHPQAGVAYSQTFTSTGGIAPIEFEVAPGTLPPGLTLSSGGVLSGTPTQTGNFIFTVTARDSSGNGYSGFTNYAATVANPAIAVDTVLPVGAVAAAYSHNLTASGGTPNYSFSLASGPLPLGLGLSPDGVLSGTPTQGGSFPISIRVTDSTTGGVYSVLQSYTVIIGAPTLSMSPAAGALPGGTQHTAYSQTVTASGGTAGYAFVVSSGALPDGLALSGAGVISGTPTAVGTFSFTIRATDSSSGSGPYTLDTRYSVMIGVPAPPTSNPVSTTVAANSGANTVTPVLIGAPATGVSIVTAPIHGTATVSGMTFVYTPTAGFSGTDSFTYRATNLGGDSAPATVTVTVTPPTLTLAGLPTTGQVGVAYSGAATATLGTVPYRFALDSGALPNGLSLAVDGTLSGTPTVAGSYTFTLEATDTYGATGTQAFTVVIDAPTITMTPAAGALPGGLRTVAYSQTFSATGGIGAHSFAVTGGALPGGLTLSPEGVLSGTPTAAGAFAFQITASDSSTPAYSGPAAAYTLDVGTPVAVVQPKTVAVIAGQSVTIDAAEGAVGVDLEAAQVATAPAHGTTSISGLAITYTANANYVGADSFTYTVTNPGGVSAPAMVSVTVNPAIVAGPPKSVTILAGQTAVVELTEGATGSPFTGAAVVSVSPANAGTATVAGRVAGGVQLYDLHFTPDNAFTGEATVLYTLSNAFATSAPGTVNVTVEARPDPSQDPEVSGLVTAQGEAARRFAAAQIANVNRRLEELHDGRAGGGFSSNLSLSGGGSLLGGGMANDPSELRRMQDAQGVMGGILDGRGAGALGFDQPSSAPEERSQDLRTPGAGGSDTPWGVWVSGAATFGRADDGLDREGFKFNTDGLTIGVDRRFGETLVFGGAVGWATDTSRIGSNGTRSEADAWSASLYGSWQPTEKAYFDIVLGYGKLDFDSRRFVTANGDFAYGQRDGDQWFGALTAGWDYRHPQGLHLSPYGRIEATRSTLDAFTEEGGGIFALAYDEQTTETLTGAIGLRGDYAFKTRMGQILPSFRIEYAYDLQGSGLQRIRYADWLDGNVYALDVADLDRNRMLYGLGLDLMRKSGLRFGVGYEGMLSGDQTSGTLRLKLQTPF